MTLRAKRAGRYFTGLCGLIVAAGIIAPNLGANRFRPKIQAALERSLGRKVDLGEVHLRLFPGAGFTVENVVIHEDPSIGLEPVAYAISLATVVRIWPLWKGRLELASIQLEDTSINLAKTGAPSETGRWNFEPLLSRSLITAFPEVHVRGGRINFKFGETKSVFYLTNTDVDISPPSGGARDWSLRFSGEPARTDRPARGFGSLTARGHWVAASNGKGGRLDLDAELQKNQIGEIIALIHGQHAGIHGLVSSRLHLAGPPDNIQISGRVQIEDVHRWDLLPSKGEAWPLTLQGRLNLPAQTVELESSSSEREALPLSVRFRAAGYLSQPHWGVSLNWNRFPAAPLLELARHMGATLPPKLKLTGWLDGAIGYEGQGSLQGVLAFHETAVTIPDSPPIRFEQARLLFDQGHVHLSPALVRTAEEDEAQLEADYQWRTQSLELSISTESMNVASLRSQVALAAVPWLEQVPSGNWKGRLHYQRSPDSTAGWTGRVELTKAEFPLPGLSRPLQVESANAQILGARVILDHIEALAGNIRVRGEYRYEPQALRPHRIHLVLPEVEATELEQLLMPSLHRSSGLIARAFGLRRVPVPEWLSRRHLEGTVQIGGFALADQRVENLRMRVLWDGARLELENLQGRIENGSVSGRLSVNLRGPKPVYRLVASVRDANWRAGNIDAQAALETTGIGAELLSNLRSEGTFTGRSVDWGLLPDCKTVSGSYRLVWAQPSPRISFSDLEIATRGEIYTGSGSTQDDGRLLIQLSSGTKEMRVTGTLAQLRLDEPVRQ